MLVLHETSCFVSDCLVFSLVLVAGIESIGAEVGGVGLGGGGRNVEDAGVIGNDGNDGVGDVACRSACIDPEVDGFGVNENDRKLL